MMDETVSTRTESNGSNSGKSQSSQEKNSSATERKTIALEEDNTPIEITWNELAVKLQFQSEFQLLQFHGLDALKVVRFIKSL